MPVTSLDTNFNKIRPTKSEMKYKDRHKIPILCSCLKLVQITYNDNKQFPICSRFFIYQYSYARRSLGGCNWPIRLFYELFLTHSLHTSLQFNDPQSEVRCSCVFIFLPSRSYLSPLGSYIFPWNILDL